MCDKLCVSKLYDDKLCVSNLCDDKLCVRKLCVSKLCVDNVWTMCGQCVDKRRREEEEEEADGGIQNQEQEPHTKMWGRPFSDWVAHQSRTNLDTCALMWF